MKTRKSSGKSTKATGTHSSSHRSTESQGIGGREFGQVIEPMQAQMASGNDGLADNSEQPEQSRRTRRTKRAA